MGEPGKAKNRLVFLDAARGVAVLLVLVQHGLGLGIPSFAKWTAENADLGRIGVLLFLCISGFIIPQSLVEGSFDRRFWLRRAFRLYPAYWVAMLFAYIYGWLDGRGGPVPAAQTGVWLVNLSMLQGFFKVPHVVNIFWTLHLELVIYLTFWMLNGLGILLKPGRLLGVLIAAYLALAFGLAVLSGKALVLSDFMNYAAAWVGFATQCVFRGKISPRWGCAALVGLVVAPLFVFITNCMYLPVDVGDFWLKYYAVNFFIAYGIFGGLIALRNVPMPWGIIHLGQISYSVYLTHPLVLTICFFQGLRGWALFVVMSFVSVLIAEALFRLVEMPSIALGKKVEGRIFGGKGAEPVLIAQGNPISSVEKIAA